MTGQSTFLTLQDRRDLDMENRFVYVIGTFLVSDTWVLGAEMTIPQILIEREE